MRRRPYVVVGSLGLVLLGVGGVVESRPSSTPRPHVMGGNVPIDGSAVDALAVSAYNSPGVVVSPRDAAVLALAARVDAPRLACALFVSRDGGATWEPRTLPVPPTPENVPCYLPDASFGVDGTLYISFGSLSHVPEHGNAPDAIWVTRSSDLGRSFSEPVRVAGPLTFQPRMVADGDTLGRLYVTWVQAAGTLAYGFASSGNPVMVSRSDDAGATWSKPIAVTAATRKRVVAPVLTSARGGGIYLAFLDLGKDDLDYLGAHEGRGGDPYPALWSMVISRSTDHGVTWKESVVADDVVPAQRVTMLFPPTPSVAVDPARHRVYVGFADGRTGDSDVAVWWSSDDAKTWSTMTRVNDNPPGDETSQYLPALGVAPHGRLDVVYFDRRDDPEQIMNTVSLQSSHDGGKSFGPRLRLSDRDFDSRIGRGSDRGLPDLGSRLGVVSASAGALAIWTDTRAGDPVTGKQDLARALVAVPAPAKGNAVLLGAGIAMTATGLLALGWSRLGRLVGPRARPRSRYA